MRRYGTSFVSIGGGEPLLYPFLFQAIQEIQEKGIQAEIVTNGSLFNKTNIKQLKATGLRFVQVSLDSSNEKTYSILRKRGNFKKVIKNIEMLAKEGFEVCISMVLTKLNFKEINFTNPSFNTFQEKLKTFLLNKIQDFSTQRYNKVVSIYNKIVTDLYKYETKKISKTVVLKRLKANIKNLKKLLNY